MSSTANPSESSESFTLPATTQYSEHQFLEYHPLLTSTSIRLVKILISEEDNIQCSMSTVDLEDEPIFDALSYTWGNPNTIHEKPDEYPLWEEHDDELSHKPKAKPRKKTEMSYIYVDHEAQQFRFRHRFLPFESVDWNADKDHLIKCNGFTIPITKNLMDALKSMRSYAAKAIPVDTTRANNDTAERWTEYMWIDAICINQNDLNECNAQVAIMSRIFSSAQIVYGWLGPAECLSDLGASCLVWITMQLSFAATPKKHSRRFPSFDCIHEKEWFAVFAFLQRLWFRRIWIVQEAVFARELMLVCGNTLLPWDMLPKAIEFMAKYKYDKGLTKFSSGLIQGGPTMERLRKNLEAGATVIGCVPRQDWDGQLRVNPRSCYSFVSGVQRLRDRLGMPVNDVPKPDARRPKLPKHGRHTLAGFCILPNRIQKRQFQLRGREVGESIHLEDLLTTFRPCDATDPRDKIFALLGIATASQEALAEFGLKADYHMTTSEVYTLTSRWFIHNSGDLRILSHIQDPSLTRIPGLPNWVPDFSVDIGRMAFGQAKPNQFSASGKYVENQVLARPMSQNLIVEGAFIDTILRLAEHHDSYFVRTGKLILQLPHWYSKAHEDLFEFQPEQHNDVSNCIKLPLYPKSEELKSHPRNSVTRVEAWWRTLIGDSIQKQHPASIHFGTGFTDWVSHELEYDILHFKASWGCIRQASKGPLPFAREVAEKLVLWKLLEIGENGGFYTPSALDSMTKSIQRKIDKSPYRGFEVDISRGGMRFLPDQKHLDKVVQPWRRGRLSGEKIKLIDEEGFEIFCNRLEDVREGHRMFRTSKDYLGMGPLSAQKGDEVWIIRGASVPFVLRLREDGTRQIIGESYVHGIMHGEALGNDSCTFSELMLS